MDDIEILKLKSAGYCCSQIMVLATLELLEKKNEDLVAFSRGLCLGGGMESGPCGILTAAISILAMYVRKGDERFALMQDSLQSFFKEAADKGGSVACIDIAGSYYPESNPEACGSLLRRCHDKVIELLVENGFDPTDNSDG